jgi:hypothetical protein
VDVVSDAESAGALAPIEVDPSALSAPPAEPATSDEPRVSIGRYLVPLRWALSWSRGDCRDCSGKGWIERVDQRGVRVLCHRCVMPTATRKLNEQLRAASPQMVPLAPPAPDPREVERHERKIAALRRELGEMEDDLTRRGVRHQKAVMAERETLGSRIAAEQDGSARLLAQTVRVDTLDGEVAELQKRLDERWEALQGAKVALEALRKEQQAISAERARLESPVAHADERFAKDTAGLRREIEKVRRRLTLALARWSPGEARAT